MRDRVSCAEVSAQERDQSSSHVTELIGEPVALTAGVKKREEANRDEDADNHSVRERTDVHGMCRRRNRFG
jgi:hypothetical protein